MNDSRDPAEEARQKFLDFLRKMRKDPYTTLVESDERDRRRDLYVFEADQDRELHEALDVVFEDPPESGFIFVDDVEEDQGDG